MNIDERAAFVGLETGTITSEISLVFKRLCYANSSAALQEFV
jgi:hypothetical protein